MIVAEKEGFPRILVPATVEKMEEIIDAHGKAMRSANNIAELGEIGL